MTYGEIQGDCHSVSWTSTPVTFFIHVRVLLLSLNNYYISSLFTFFYFGV